jgi:hypothetical protein
MHCGGWTKRGCNCCASFAPPFSLSYGHGQCRSERFICLHECCITSRSTCPRLAVAATLGRMQWGKGEGFVYCCGADAAAWRLRCYDWVLRKVKRTMFPCCWCRESIDSYSHLASAYVTTVLLVRMKFFCNAVTATKPRWLTA